MSNHLETLNDPFNSFSKELLCQQQQRDPLSLPQPKDDTSPVTVLSPPLNLVRTIDNMQVDHGIESMIDETNVDKLGRTKTTPLLYQVKQKEFEAFRDIVDAGTKIKKTIHDQSLQGEAIYALRSFQGAEK